MKVTRENCFRVFKDRLMLHLSKLKIKMTIIPMLMLLLLYLHFEYNVVKGVSENVKQKLNSEPVSEKNSCINPF